jgi:RimJ/RimL family protein N-acetyltransferase
MITTEHLIIDTDKADFGTLHLAPFAEPEMEQYMPLPEAFTRHNPPAAFEDLDTAEAYLEADRDDEHFVAWGMYVGSIATKNFVGTIGTSASNAGTFEEPEWTRGVQNVHTGIFSAEWHRRSIGTIAKLAIAKYAFEEQGTRVLFAETSVNNLGANKSLERCGFLPTETMERYTFSDGSLTQLWMLADVVVQEAMPDLQPVLQEGWEVYQAALANITVKNVCLAPQSR